MDKSLVRLWKREDSNDITINEREDITNDTTEMHRIIKDYYEQLYDNKLDNLEEIVKFLETHNLLKQNQEDTKNLKRQLWVKLLNEESKPSDSGNPRIRRSYWEILSNI